MSLHWTDHWAGSDRGFRYVKVELSGCCSTAHLFRHSCMVVANHAWVSRCGCAPSSQARMVRPHAHQADIQAVAGGPPVGRIRLRVRNGRTPSTGAEWSAYTPRPSGRPPRRGDPIPRNSMRTFLTAFFDCGGHAAAFPRRGHAPALWHGHLARGLGNMGGTPMPRKAAAWPPQSKKGRFPREPAALGRVGLQCGGSLRPRAGQTQSSGWRCYTKYLAQSCPASRGRWEAGRG